LWYSLRGVGGRLPDGRVVRFDAGVVGYPPVGDRSRRVKDEHGAFGRRVPEAGEVVVPDTVGVDDLLVGVADQPETEVVLFSELVERERRIDAHAVDGRSHVLELGEAITKATHLSPAGARERAGEEDQHHRAVAQLLGEGNGLGVAGGERCREIGRLVSDLGHGSSSVGRGKWIGFSPGGTLTKVYLPVGGDAGVVALDSPYSDGGVWLRGNLHTHSTVSDGTRAPERVIEDYAARGYDFLALSDHDTFVDPAEYRSETGMVLVPAVEVSDGGPHTLHVGATGAVPPHEDRQRVVDAIDDDSGFAVPAHPNWQAAFSHWPHADLERIGGFAGIEIYNGLIEQHPGAATATDRWDRLLADGRRVWGFANDDAHRPWEVARGWNVVQVERRTPAAVLAALAEGRFYASTGVTVRSIDVSGGAITVETADADRIEFVSDAGRVQRVVDGPAATCRIPDHLVHGSNAGYVRAECYGAGGERAWLQPVFLER